MNGGVRGVRSCEGAMIWPCGHHPSILLRANSQAQAAGCGWVGLDTEPVLLVWSGRPATWAVERRQEGLGVACA